MQIREHVLNAGFRPHYKGYEYLVRAVEMMVEKQVPISGIYGVIAKEFGVTTGSVERNMRTIVNAWWEQGGRLYSMQQRPFAGELVAVLAERIRIDASEGKPAVQP